MKLGPISIPFQARMEEKTNGRETSSQETTLSMYGWDDNIKMTFNW